MPLGAIATALYRAAISAGRRDWLLMRPRAATDLLMIKSACI